MKNFRIFLLVCALGIAVMGCVQRVPTTENSRIMSKATSEQVNTPQEAQIPSQQGQEQTALRKHFSQFDSAFRFSATVPENFKIEYVPEIQSINIYDPGASGSSVREQSQIFIRYFEADRFLTLATVTILSREETKIRGHDAVRYEIEKKPGSATFSHQPPWRNGRHKLIDIRLVPERKTYFYVFTYNPLLPQEIFDQFIDSLIFHNDRESFVSPLNRPQERISKKPFGIHVSPDSSPVGLERFNGYHTGVDFEVFEEEYDAVAVPVLLFCSGTLLEKREAEGYGGVVVQECLLENSAVTVVYGHLQLTSITFAAGDYLHAGDTLGVLGRNKSTETDGERRHLHLGIHKGAPVDIRGYAVTKQDLGAWVDPLEFLQQLSKE